MADNNGMKWDVNSSSYDTSFWTPEQWQKFGASGGTVDSAGQLITGTGQILNPYTGMLSNSVVNTDNTLGLSGNQWSTLTNVGGLAMKAIALPQQMEYYGAQTDLAKQQLASNQQAMADRKTFNANWANASNGLAGRASQVV